MMTRFLGGTVIASSQRGRREIPAADFFVGSLVNSLEPDEFVIRVELDAMRPDAGWGFEEFAKRHGDFALACFATTLHCVDGRASDVRVGMMGVGETPLRLEEIIEDGCFRAGSRYGGGSPGWNPHAQHGYPCLCRLPQASLRRPCQTGPSRRLEPREPRKASSKMSEKTITVSVNEAYMTRTIEARTLLSHFLRQDPLPDRNPCRVRTWRLRCLHRHSRWKERTLLSDACSAGRRERNRNHGQGSVDTRTNPRSVPPASWPAMRICRPSFIVGDHRPSSPPSAGNR